MSSQGSHAPPMKMIYISSPLSRFHGHHIVSASQIDVRESKGVKWREMLWSTMATFINMGDFTFEKF